MSSAAPVLDFSASVPNHRALHDEIASCHPSLLGDALWCAHCVKSRTIEAGKLLRNGWPRCRCVKREVKAS